MGNWNIEWFGNQDAGPSNEGLQLTNARTVLSSADADVWGLQEVADAGHFAALVSGLGPAYGSLLVTDPFVANNWGYSGIQKLALVYRQSVVTVRSAQVILPTSSGLFAGRPPFRVDLRLTRDGRTADLVVIIVHLKANEGQADWAQRRDAAIALKSYLDSTLPSTPVLVIGDWNDDVDVSISVPNDTPFRNFLDSPASYTFVSRALSDAGVPSTTMFPEFIDHQMISDEVFPLYLAGSVRSLRPGTDLPLISGYPRTTSDHYPTLSRYDLAAIALPLDGPSVFINEILANPPELADGGQDFSRQFVELVNGGPAAVDLGGWAVEDQTSFIGTGARHVFAPGTVLEPGKGIAVVSSAPGLPGVGRAVTASSGGLFLNVGTTETVYLLRPDGGVADQHTYSSPLDAISINRSPDLSAAGGFVLHTAINPALPASPGVRATGAAF